MLQLCFSVHSVRKLKILKGRCVKPTLLLLALYLVVRFRSKILTTALPSTENISHLNGIPIEPYRISGSYEEVRRIFLSTDNDVCKKQAQWGGLSVLFPIPSNSSYQMRKAGNYSICMDNGVRPSPGRCIVYSFGIQFEWSFDEAAEDYGCKVFSFDPSMKIGPRKYSESIDFYNIGLSGFDGVVKKEGMKKGWDMRRLSTIIERLGHRNSIIDVLKIDIEEDEHEAIPDIIKSGILTNVKQVIWEIHKSDNITLDTFYSTYWLLERIGFKKFYTEDWDHPDCLKKNSKGEQENYCYIFSNVNVNFQTAKD